MRFGSLALLLIGVFPCHSSGQTRGTVRAGRSVARVEVLAFDTRGKFLGAPTIEVFEADNHTNFAAKFHAGVAEDIPFGEYRIKSDLPAYSSEARFIRVYQRRVTVVLGLTVGYELPSIPLSLHGRVVGRVPPQRTFVRLAGVFSSLSMESPIGPDGGFDLVGLTWGKYLLLVVGEDGVLASRALTIPYTGPPLEIDIRADRTIAPER
jgi:hypothetical protein